MAKSKDTDSFYHSTPLLRFLPFQVISSSRIKIYITWFGYKMILNAHMQNKCASKRFLRSKIYLVVDNHLISVCKSINRRCVLSRSCDDLVMFWCCHFECLCLCLIHYDLNCNLPCSVLFRECCLRYVARHGWVVLTYTRFNILVIFLLSRCSEPWSSFRR